MNKKKYEVKRVVKNKLKVRKALIAASFFMTIIAIATPVMGCRTNGILIFARGDDGDIAGARTSIIAFIEYDKDSGIPSAAHVIFQTKIYDESGEKIYSMKGMFKDALVISNSFQFYCDVREVMWINLWFIMGEGKLKTTDADIEIEYRGGTVTLPNTEGKYIPFSFWLMVNPKGEYILGDDPEIHIWPEGGWATVIATIEGIPSIGVVTYLTSYIEI
jgi:hypothetical protein